MCHKILSTLIDIKYFQFLKNINLKYQVYSLIFAIFFFHISEEIIINFHLKGMLRTILILLPMSIFALGSFFFGLKNIMDNVGNIQSKFWSVNDCIKLFIAPLILLNMAIMILL